MREREGVPAPNRSHGDDVELVWNHYGLDMHERHEAKNALLNDPVEAKQCYRLLAEEILSGKT